MLQFFKYKKDEIVTIGNVKDIQLMKQVYIEKAHDRTIKFQEPSFSM